MPQVPSSGQITANWQKGQFEFATNCESGRSGQSAVHSWALSGFLNVFNFKK